MKKIIKGWVQSILRKNTVKVLQKNYPDIIGITGSVGKSSAKEAIYQVLSKSKKFTGKVRKSSGNFNTEIGTPLSILNFNKVPKFYEWPFVLILAFLRANLSWLNPLKNFSTLILEFAADKPDDIYYLTSFIKPRIAVITYIGEAHLEFFDSIDQIAIEKANIVRVVPKENGFVILNSDNDYCWRIGLALKGRKEVIFYGSSDKADLRVSDIKFDFNGTDFKISYKNVKKDVHLQTIGQSQVYAALAAIAVGIADRIELDEIIYNLLDYKSLAGRDKVLDGISGSKIIDSSYNANPSSMKAALETLKNLKTNGEKIAVLGGMKEIGKISSDAHKEIAELAKNIADKVILIGDDFKSEKANKWFKTSDEATKFLLDKIEKDDIILIKGSHAIQMENIVRTLIAHK